MGYDYALVHVKYTIPPGILLTLLYKPLLTKIDVYKICFLITIAVVSTIPWDSYLIRTRVWSYPDDAVLGPTIYRIPLEELFFFVIQTYDVCLLYLCLNKPIFHPAYVPHHLICKDNSLKSQWTRQIIGRVVQCGLLAGIALGAYLVQHGGTGTYMGLIVVWSFPFLLLLWSLSHQFLLRLPLSSCLYPIVAPTLYLWLVDTFALRRGTWVIEKDTKLGLYIWDGLEVEEAFFFLATNTLIVFGLTAFGYAIAIIDSFPNIFPRAPVLPTPTLLVRALLTSSAKFNADRIVGIGEAVKRLQSKSRSFYLASGAFERRLRIDLILLQVYSFCRMADDLIDEDYNLVEDSCKSDKADRMRLSITRLRTYLDNCYKPSNSANAQALQIYVDTEFSQDCRRSLRYLPASVLSKQPLYDLLKGFELDRDYARRSKNERFTWPIDTQKDLELYGYYVAGTIAELCLDLVFHHCTHTIDKADQARLKRAGATMGLALQTINIARDIQIDAEKADQQRVYIPTDWLRDEGLTPEDVLADPQNKKLRKIRTRLLDLAFEAYHQARPAMDELPVQVRAAMRVAIESYAEIGRVLRSEDYRVVDGRATVNKTRRLWVAYKALSG